MRDFNMQFKAIIFDMDGTLIDSMQLWRDVDAEFLGKRNIPIPADLFDHLPSGNSFIQTALYFKERFGLEDSVGSIMREWTDMVSWHYLNTVVLKAGAREALEYIKSLGLPLGLGTSNSWELAEQVLSAQGIWDYFNTVVTGDMELMGKPYPDIYLKNAEELGLLPEECLVIEDTLTGIQAAKAARMTAWAIYDADSNSQRRQIKELADEHHDDYGSIHNRLRSIYQGK